MRLPSFYDLVEAIYFHDLIPAEITLRSNDLHGKIKPTSRYVFIGFAYTDSLSHLSLSFNSGAPFGEFMLIGWQSTSNNHTIAFRSIGLTTKFPSGNGEEQIICQNTGGLTRWWKDCNSH